MPTEPDDNDFIKPMTVRLPIPLADELATVAEVDHLPRAAVVRKALADYLAARRADPEFQRVRAARIDYLRRMAGPARSDPPRASQ